MKRNEKLKEEQLRLIKLAKIISNCSINDINPKTYKHILKAISYIDKALDEVLITQKKNGKIFMSDEDIDNVIKNAKKDLVV